MTEQHDTQQVEAVARMAEECRQRAVEIVVSQRRQWFCSGEDCTMYDHGRDEGFDLSLKILKLLDPFTDEVRATLTRALPIEEAQPLAAEDALSDPNAVHLNMLRGSIAKPTPRSIWHLYGDEALIAAMPESAREILAAAPKPPTPAVDRDTEVERLRAALCEARRWVDASLTARCSVPPASQPPVIPLLVTIDAALNGRTE